MQYTLTVRRLCGWLGVLLLGCGGETLQIGYDDPALSKDPAESVDTAAAVTRCGAPGSGAEPAGSPKQRIDAGRALGVGRWFACPSNPSSPGVPAAIELTADSAFRLHDVGGGVYARGPQEKAELLYSVLNASLVLVLGGVEYLLSFQRNPLRMTWSAGSSTYLFVKI